MKIGKMRERVAVQENQSSTRNDMNEPIAAWVTLFTLWAQVEDIGGSEFWEGQRVNSKTTHGFTFRGIAGILPSMRFVLHAGNYNITRIRDIDQIHRTLKIEAEIKNAPATQGGTI